MSKDELAAVHRSVGVEVDGQEVGWGIGRFVLRIDGEKVGLIMDGINEGRREEGAGVAVGFIVG